MADTAPLAKAYVLTAASNLTEPTSVEQLKLNQFINLLVTCNISVQSNSTLPHDTILAEYGLIFIDFANLNALNSIPEKVLTLTKTHKVVLFNCQHELLSEKLALLAGIYGALYTADRVDIILRGIESLLAGKRWFKRGTMNTVIDELLSNSTSVLQDNFFAPSDKFLFPSLTKRENTIIKLVSSGAQNKEIANKLHISPNTVKTHIYSIFRKTSSRNRIELVSWTQQFQPQN